MDGVILTLSVLEERILETLLGASRGFTGWGRNRSMTNEQGEVGNRRNCVCS